MEALEKALSLATWLYISGLGLGLLVWVALPVKDKDR